VALGASRPLAARFMFADTKLYLPDDLLTKLDRATMAVSLEGRVPLLDHRVVEWAWRLPMPLRRSKSLLRRVLARYVPRPLFERPKMGFEVPLAAWLRGPLRDWATGCLMSHDLGGDGLFNREAVASRWRRVVAGHREVSLIWNVLMFEEWRRRWRATL
jgi:asparagine synthase (glutamine-hydrolysing)